jgi:hypothetical protein
MHSQSDSHLLFRRSSLPVCHWWALLAVSPFLIIPYVRDFDLRFLSLYIIFLRILVGRFLLRVGKTGFEVFLISLL